MPRGIRDLPDYDRAEEARQRAILQEIIHDILFGSPPDESRNELPLGIRKRIRSLATDDEISILTK